MGFNAPAPERARLLRVVPHLAGGHVQGTCGFALRGLGWRCSVGATKSTPRWRRRSRFSIAPPLFLFGGGCANGIMFFNAKSASASAPVHVEVAALMCTEANSPFNADARERSSCEGRHRQLRGPVASTSPAGAG
jgi:hypothetical protein